MTNLINKVKTSVKSAMSSNSEGTGIVQLDPWLEPFKGTIKRRYDLAQKWIGQIDKDEGGLDKFSKGFDKFGLNAQPNGDIVYREYVPNASRASLIGDFNSWNKDANPMRADNFGVWEVVVPAVNGQPAIPHRSKIKIAIVTKDGKEIYRLPAWIKYVSQDLSVSAAYDAVFWNPPKTEQYTFRNQRPPKPEAAKIYEAHVGISSPEQRVTTYREFTQNILPKIQDLGYNTIQLMAIMEHAYYASFGYQVTSFFAPSSRYGTPEDLKELIDTAHGLGLQVLLDVVHSHACKNVEDGLNMFDGTDYLYFHGGAKGFHTLWDSRLFNYGNPETLRFLLSNLRYWMDEFQFDGFRFDGVTSIMYKHHGIGYGFSGDYNEYFGDGGDDEGIVYLMLANELLRSLYPTVVTIAEDVSGMPGLCVPLSLGGIGFDYRLAMAVPDLWIKMLKEQTDVEWNMGTLTHTLINRRHGEKTIAYAESHDQALVGDKSLMMWLVNEQIYTHMSVLSENSPKIQRGIALHKMIRLITHSLAGEGYLNFEGNEFGHPEWLDFPRAGNNNSFMHARRQFNLIQDHLLRYSFLYEFDKEMNLTESKYKWLSAPQAYVSLKHEKDKVVVYERAGLVFVFNFNPSESFADFRIGIEVPGTYRVVLDTDSGAVGGFDRIDKTTRFFTTPMEWNGRKNFAQVYIPMQTALVLALE